PLFANNAALIKEYGDQLREAGVVRTQESIDKSLILNAQTQALSTQFQGFKNQLAGQMTPVLSNLIQYFVDGAVKSGSFGTVLSAVGTVAKVVGIAIVGVASAVSVVIQSISGFASLIDHVGNVAARLDAATTIKEQINVLKSGFSEGKDIWNGYAAGIDKTLKSTMDFVSNVKTGTMPALTGLSAAQLKVNQANLANSKSTITDTETAKENAKAKAEQAKAAAKAAKAQEDLNKMVGASALSGLRIKGQESIAGGQVRAYTANFAQLTQSALGKGLNRFTAFNDLYHKGTNSKHATGNAFDFTLDDAKKSSEAVSQLEQMAKRYGFVVKVLDEYRNPSKRATGGHIHVSVLGYKGTADALKDANAELDIVQKANDEATRIQEERQKQQLAITAKYATPEQKLALDNAEAIKQIKLAYANDPVAAEVFLNLQAKAYQKDLEEYRATQNQKLISATETAAQAAENWNRTYADMTGTGSLLGLQQTQSDRYKESFALFDSQSAVLDQQATDPNADIQAIAEQREQLWQQHTQRMLLIDQTYNREKASLGLQSASETLGGMADLMGGLLGEQSAGYKAMFAMSKAFAIAKVLMNAPETYSETYKSVSMIPMIGPYMAPAMAAGAVAVQLGQAAQIKSVNLTGMAHNGIDNVPAEGTWLLDGGERVLN
ncbi:ATP synthase F1 subunit delta, partial [Acinetobacter baumannii]